jgi:hypothetical protein
MGCGCSRPRRGFGARLTSSRIQSFLEQNRARHAEIIGQGPLLPLYGNGGPIVQADHLPKRPFKLYNGDGAEAEVGFETEAIFSNPNGGRPERIFYSEIHNVLFSPIDGFESLYMQMALETDVGFRIFFFLPRQYQTIITHILKGRAGA